MIQPYVGSQTPLINIEEEQMDLISIQISCAAAQPEGHVL